MSARVVIHDFLRQARAQPAGRPARPFLAIDPKPTIGDTVFDPWSLVAQLGWPFRLADAAVVVPRRIRWLADRLDLDPSRIAAWGIARDVEVGLRAASVGRSLDRARWIRSATNVAPTLG